MATSTVAANAVVDLAKENGIDVEIAQVRISEIESNLPADLIVTTSKVKRDYGVPLITGMPFISESVIKRKQDFRSTEIADTQETSRR